MQPVAVSAPQARRIALAAQGFADRPHQRPTMRTLLRTVRRTGVLQVDSVNVLQRAHYLPLYSRMGPYDVDLLRRASEGRPRHLVEYWAHMQALMPVELWPVMKPRMDRLRAQRGKWWRQTTDEMGAEILAQVRDRGAVTARDLEDDTPRTREHWGWNWSEARRVLDALYCAGDVAIAGRTAQFEVVYDLPERVLPAEILARPALEPDEAARELVRRAARSHGVASLACLADYYRMARAAARRAVDELVEEGELLPAAVEGWARPAYLHVDAARPRRIEARALLSPFDPVVWERARAEALFGFHYRIEIYVPAAKRRYGYYVLPFLLGDRMVARVDLKADRARGVLIVRAAYTESHAPPETAAELAAELLRLGAWLGLGEILVEQRGDLAAALTQEVRR